MMSDDFIPLNQSTPIRQKWQPGRNQHQRQNQHTYRQNGNRRDAHNNKWGTSPRSSFGSNSSYTSFNQDSRHNIDAYLHPSMLEDPWADLRKMNQNQEQLS